MPAGPKQRHRHLEDAQRDEDEEQRRDADHGDDVGGDLCLDLTNTVGGATKTRERETLTTFAALLAWARAAKALDPGEAAALAAAAERAPAEAAGPLARLRAFREALHAVLTSRAHGAPVPPAELAAVEGTIREAHGLARLAPDPDGFAWSIDAGTAGLDRPGRARDARAMPDPISWSLAAPYLIAAFVLGYLLGSVPFGLVLSKLAGLADPRTTGSGNIGATNVLRSGRRDLALATLLLDAGKGAAAVLVAGRFGPDVALMAAYGAVLGHMLPVWLRFRGGKGVATTLGTHLAVAWPMGAGCCGVWLLVAAATRYSSLAALVSVASAPAFAWWLTGDLQLVQYAVVMAALVWLRHHANIRRLLKGEESRIGARGKG